MKDYSFDFQYRVKYFDTDKMGYVHNSNYFRFFEIGREETMREIGFSYNDVENCGIMMPLVEQYARYHTPAKYDDLITIRTTLKELPQAVIKFEYEVFSVSQGKKSIHANGWNKLCFVDSTTRKPKRCPQFLTEILKKVLSV